MLNKSQIREKTETMLKKENEPIKQKQHKKKSKNVNNNNHNKKNNFLDQ